MTAAAVRPWPGDLEWGGDWVAESATELARLGFVLRDGSETGTLPGPRLLVALRAQPTLQHFDPEEAGFWEVDRGRGRRATLTFEAATPGSRAFSWGRISVTDRVPVSNQFLAFGGRLLVERLDATTVLAAFVSPAPIVRWAGHSQGVDPFADDIGSFFARLMVPVDFQAGAEERIAAASPEVLYAVFLCHASRRLHARRALREADPVLAVTVAHEVNRLRADRPAAWRDGESLLDWLELV